MLLRIIFGALGSAELQPCQNISLWNTAAERGSTNIRVGAAFSVADGVWWGADAFVSNLNKAVCTGEATGISGGAYGGSVIRISTVGTVVPDLEKVP